MGSGKTTVGKLVAKGLNRQFVDTDEFLEAHYGPAKYILNSPGGDDVFNAIEEAIAQTLSSQSKRIIATGGRFCLNPKNVAALSHNSIFLCLHAPLEELVSRLTVSAQNTYRPRFAASENKYQLMHDLSVLSEPHFSHFEQIPTGGRPPQAVADELILRFG